MMQVYCSAKSNVKSLLSLLVPGKSWRAKVQVENLRHVAAYMYILRALRVLKLLHVG